MLSKRKAEEYNITSVKKAKGKRSISWYIEHERKKFLLDQESSESVEIYLHESLEKLKNYESSDPDQLRGFFDIETFGTEDLNELPSTTAPFGISICSSLESSSEPQISVSDLSSIVANNDSSEGNSSARPPIIAYMLNSDLDPLYHGDPSRPWDYTPIVPQSYVDAFRSNRATFANFNSGFNSISGPQQDSSASMISSDSLIAKLIDILRDWNLALYQKCMEDYNIIRRRNPEFWDKMLLKTFPHTMLAHCAKSDITADFFHSMCKDSKTLSILVKINSSYIQFFLMNMAASNRVEYSFILESDMWQLVKRELVVRAFVAGQVTNLQLFLQYFRPDDLLSCTDMEFLNCSSDSWSPGFGNVYTIASNYCGYISSLQVGGVDIVAAGYNGNFTLLNLVRVASYVTESLAPISIKADCIRLFWRASTTPYVTLDDINEAFLPLNSSQLLRHTLLRHCKDRLIEAYPDDCLAEYQPRSLMHLSRCTVRQAITSPVYIPSLPLPDKLRAYINLEW